MVRCVLLIAALATASPSTPQSQIAEIEKGSGGRIGVVAIDWKSGRRIENRLNERFPMCSTFKTLAVAAVLQRVDRGKEKLDRFVSYSQKDILEYAPVTKQHLAEGGMTLEALCAAAIEQSDNTAANLLLQTIDGPSGVTEFARSIHDSETRLDRKEPELNDWREGDERDTTTPAAMCQDLQVLLTRNVLSQQSQDRLKHWLEGNQTGAGLIRAGVPEGWRVADKTGRSSSSGATNDVAVIYPPRGQPIFLAVYFLNPSASDEQRSTAIAKVARIVSENFKRAP